MRAALGCPDVVDVAVGRLVVAVVVLEREFESDAVHVVGDVDRILVERRLAFVHRLHERTQTALEVELLVVLLTRALVAHLDTNAGVQVGELAQARSERLVVELDAFEDLAVGHEGDLRATSIRLLAAIEVPDGNAPLVGMEPAVAVTPDLDVESRRKGVDDRDADTVQTARNLVGVLVELPARVKRGHDDLERGLVRFVRVDRNPAAIVDDRDAAVLVDADRDVLAVAGQGFVDAVVDDFVDEVVKTRRVDVPDVHGGTLADRFEALEDLDVLGVVTTGSGHGSRTPFGPGSTGLYDSLYRVEYRVAHRTTCVKPREWEEGPGRDPLRKD